MTKRIVITGPESTGKTTLAKQLAKAFHTLWVPEFAREYLEQINRKYQKKDLLDIAYGQVEKEDQLANLANEYLFCDTDLITVKIWSEYKYGDCDERILSLIEEREYTTYLLCIPDFPWVFDPQRENPSNRAELLQLYRQALNEYQKSYIEIQGTPERRFQMALKHIRNV